MNENIIHQHDQLFKRADLGTGQLPVGPFPRSNFPLLKLEKKHHEFYLRVDKNTINRYYLDENKNQKCTLLFYPSKHCLEEINRLKASGEVNHLVIKLYAKLLNDGLGSTVVPRIKSKIVELKKKNKTKSKKLNLKPKRRKLELKKKNKKMKLKVKTKKLKLKVKG